MINLYFILYALNGEVLNIKFNSPYACGEEFRVDTKLTAYHIRKIPSLENGVALVRGG